VEKKPEEKKKSPSPQKGEAPEFVEKFEDTVSAIASHYSYHNNTSVIVSFIYLYFEFHV